MKDFERGIDQGTGIGEQHMARDTQHAGEGGRCDQCQSWQY